MKTDRKKLYKKIENAIAKGVANGEEVDVTAKSIMDTVWPIIDFLQVHGKPSKDYVNEYLENQNTFSEIKFLRHVLRIFDKIPCQNEINEDGLAILLGFSGVLNITDHKAIAFLERHKGKSKKDIDNITEDFLNKVFPNA